MGGLPAALWGEAADPPAVQVPFSLAGPVPDSAWVPAPAQPEADFETMAAQASGPAGPQITIWYGLTQEFGQIGKPIPWVNILGHAADADGLTAVSYSLNGGTHRSISFGPEQNPRLVNPGDFNAEIANADLLPGENSVLIRATDTLGAQSEVTVTVINSAGPVWALPYQTDWGGVSAIGDTAQVSDGLWTIEGATLRPVEWGYDRLIAIGDLTWTDYEVTALMTVHAIDPDGFAPPSNGPAIGYILRWPGHNGSGQPRVGFYPLGAIGMYRWSNTGSQRFQLRGNNGAFFGQAPTSDVLQLGVAYYFKMRVETVPGGAQYSFKTWPEGAEEPAAWKLSAFQAEEHDPGQGSALLLVHHVDVNIGNVCVVPGPFTGPPQTCGCADSDRPVLLHSTPFAGYVDARMESSDGLALDQGIDRITLQFSEPVFDAGSTAGGTAEGTLTPAAFTLAQTGGAPPPGVIAVESADGISVEVVFDRVITVREWTTVIAAVEDSCGNAIEPPGELSDPDRVDVAFLPGDIDQNGQVKPIDLLRWRQIQEGTFVPPQGHPADYIDTDRNGVIGPTDFLRFRQLLFGTGFATQAWSDQELLNPRP